MEESRLHNVTANTAPLYGKMQPIDSFAPVKNVSCAAICKMLLLDDFSGIC